MIEKAHEVIHWKLAGRQFSMSYDPGLAWEERFFDWPDDGVPIPTEADVEAWRAEWAKSGTQVRERRAEAYREQGSPEGTSETALGDAIDALAEFIGDNFSPAQIDGTPKLRALMDLRTTVKAAHPKQNGSE